MKSRYILIILLSGAFFLTGCYNAKVSTGLEPSNQVIEQSFASSWIYGLVPPSVVEAQNQCQNGVAEVETKLSFLNMLVGNLTGGIYTPMYIKVTCAAGTRAEVSTDEHDIYTINNDDPEEVTGETIRKATEKSLETNRPFFLDMN